MRYETLEILSPVMDKRNIDAGFLRWRRSGVYNVYQQFTRGGRRHAPGAYECDGICAAAVSYRSRLFYLLSLYFVVLCFPQADGRAAPTFAFSVEPDFLSGDCGRIDSVNDTSV